MNIPILEQFKLRGDDKIMKFYPSGFLTVKSKQTTLFWDITWLLLVIKPERISAILHAIYIAGYLTLTDFSPYLGCTNVFLTVLVIRNPLESRLP